MTVAVSVWSVLIKTANQVLWGCWFVASLCVADNVSSNLGGEGSSKAGWFSVTNTVTWDPAGAVGCFFRLLRPGSVQNECCCDLNLLILHSFLFLLCLLGCGFVQIGLGMCIWRASWGEGLVLPVCPSSLAC